MMNIHKELPLSFPGCPPSPDPSPPFTQISRHYLGPEIRVWKMNPKKQSSHWLFSTEDCKAYRETHEDERSGPDLVPDDVEDSDDLDAMIEHYRARATANL